MMRLQNAREARALIHEVLVSIELLAMETPYQPPIIKPLTEEEYATAYPERMK